MEYKNYGRVGVVKDSGTTMSFQIGDGIPLASTDIDSDAFGQSGSFTPVPLLLNIGNTRILSKGINNLLPVEIKQMFGGNRILPELIDKQYRLLYGKGLFAYKLEFDKGKLNRDWQQNETIDNWLGDWQSKGLVDSPEQYIEKVIKDSYYYEDYFSKWRFFKGRRLGRMPVAGLEHIENKRGRLGTTQKANILTDDYQDSDFDRVLLGNWGSSFSLDTKDYPRLNLGRINEYETAIAYHKHHSPGEIYGMNKFYIGIKDWLTATNRNPIYINSYLENSLSAKVHVIIPQEWVSYISDKIQGYCDINVEREEEHLELLQPNGITVGTHYHEGLLDDYIKAEMKKLTQFMSGKLNQGKTFTTFKYQTDRGDSVGWEIVPIDMKYKEYMSALTDYDKRADEVITSSIGIDSSISNISKDGVISKSGADSYYNYIIYLHANLPTAERVCCEDLNWAIRANFPSLYKQGYRIGLYTDIPSQQEDVAPDNRLQSQMNGISQTQSNQQSTLNEIKSLLTHENH